MKKGITVFATTAFLVSGSIARAAVPAPPDDVADVFKGYDATFVLYDTKKNQSYVYNPERANERLTPCSTFKIFNALVGLETGVLTGPQHLMKWDGKVDHRPECNKDHTLQSAVKESVVWYFQRVAESIGQERMQKYIDLVGYGNRDISGGITQFWLDSTLKISANEQVAFLKNLVNNSLPFKKSTMDTVKEIIVVQKTPKGILHGKTGTNGRGGKNVMGWFVGYVETPGDTYVFATNIAAADGAMGRKARALTEEILKRKDLL